MVPWDYNLDNGGTVSYTLLGKITTTKSHLHTGPDLPLSGLKAEPHKWPEHNRHWSGPTNLNCSDKLESDILYSAGVSPYLS